MVHVTLTSEESSILLTTLEEYLSDLRMEIADTDLKSFRDQLKAKKMILQSIVEKLQKALQEERPEQPTQTPT